MIREMKNSGVEWIGDIPSEWKVENLQWNMNEIIEKNSPIKITSVLSLTKEKGVIPYEDKGNQGNKSKESIEDYKIAYKGTIVANSMNILIGSVGISNYDGCVSPVYYVFKNNNKTDLRFLNYIFTTEQFQKQLRKYANGILEIRLRVSSENIMKQKVMFPPLHEQKKIADFLDTKVTEIDKIISETKASIENYKEYKQSVITEAVTKGLDKNVPMKDSGIEWIGYIPKSRNVITPKVLFTLRKERAKCGERQLTASQQYGVIYQDEYMRITDTRIVTVEKDFEILKHVEKGDFVISMRSFQGGIEYSENTGSISSAYVILIPNLKYVYPPFYKWLLKSSAYINALQSTSNLVRDGQAMRYANFIQVPLFTVPLKEQIEIATYLDRKCTKIDNLVAEKEKLITNLKEYKKSLIYEYVTGKKVIE